MNYFGIYSFPFYTFPQHKYWTFWYHSLISFLSLFLLHSLLFYLPPKSLGRKQNSTKKRGHLSKHNFRVSAEGWTLYIFPTFLGGTWKQLSFSIKIKSFFIWCKPCSGLYVLAQPKQSFILQEHLQWLEIALCPIREQEEGMYSRNMSFHF